jgi:phytoene/squalene synthetase
MTFAKGQSGNPRGRAIERPFANILNDEIARAGDDYEALRKIARNLIKQAQRNTLQALPAITAIADRLDGKPMQQTTLTMVKRDASDWTRQELMEFLQNASHQVEANEANDPKLIEAKPVEDKSSE